MKKALAIMLICLWLAGGAAAQDKKESGSAEQQKPIDVTRPAAATAESKPEAKPAAAEAMPSVDQILEKHVQAVGGKAAIEKFNTLTAKGAFDLPAMGASGTVELYSKAPNKSFTIISIPGFGEVKQGFDGTAGWAQDPTSGKFSDVSGTELGELKINADFYRDYKLKEFYPQMTLKGKEQSGGREVYVIEASAPGVTKKMYFDAGSGLLARMDSVLESANGKRSIEEYFDDYKVVEGVKFAHTYRQINPEYDFTFKFNDVKFNAAIDDAKFVKPAAE